MGKPLSSSFPIRSSARSLGSEACPAVLPPGERARCSACLPPRRRWTGMTLMSFHKNSCLHKHIVNEYKTKKAIKKNMSGEGSSHTQL